MILEISVSAIAITLILCCIFLIITFFKVKTSLKSANKSLQHIGSETIRLISKINDLIADLQSKSDSLDIVFRPLKSMRKSKVLKSETTETVSEIVEWVSTSLALFNKIKNAVKRREK